MLLMWRKRKLRDEGTTGGHLCWLWGQFPQSDSLHGQRSCSVPLLTSSEGSETRAGQPQETSRRIKHMTGQHGVWREQGGQGPL